MVRFSGRPLGLNPRAVYDILNGEISPGRYRHLTMNKFSKTLFELGEPLGGVKSESNRLRWWTIVPWKFIGVFFMYQITIALTVKLLFWICVSNRTIV